jgi:tRNA pseudouridine38-40 synthase
VDLAKYVLVVEYDGTYYHGFQWQASLPTIQSELEQAMRRFCGYSSRIMGASRTDAGVHAKGQVASFWARRNLSRATLVKALNYYLPEDIAIKAAYAVDGNFSVRRQALSREYHYYILNANTRSSFSQRFALFLPKTLDINMMNEACELVQGERDFASFATSVDNARSTVRHVYQARICRRKDFIVFHVVANSFLPHQVRNTMGLLIRLGTGKISITDFSDIMEAKTLGLAGPMAPAKGLCLTKVNYSKPLSHFGPSFVVASNQDSEHNTRKAIAGEALQGMCT